jgi:hypothetical protein
MANTIKIKRGLKENLPTLEIGEQAYCTDTNELFIGTSTGNVLLNEDTDISTIDNIGDVSITTPAQGEVLVYDGTNWVNDEVEAGLTLEDLPNRASISHPTNTGSVTNTHFRQVNSSSNSIASGAISQVNASISSTASGGRSQVNASLSSTASGAISQVNASSSSTASGFISQVNASNDSNASGFQSQINASTSSVASGFQSQINASAYSVASNNYSQVNASSSSTAGGFYSQVNSSRNSSINATRTIIEASDSLTTAITRNLSVVQGTSNTQRIRLESDTGVGRFRGGTSTSGFDFAELFENGTGKEIGPGLLITLNEDKAVIAQENDRVIGVVSHTYGYLGNGSDMQWEKVELRDEFGRLIMESIKDHEYKTKEQAIKELEEKGFSLVDEYPANREENVKYILKEDLFKRPYIVENEKDIPLITVPKKHPDYDPERTKDYVARVDRPDEWTPVGLVGQVYVRLKEDVKVGDNVKAWKDGVGQASEEYTNIIVMKITQDYDKEKGYAIGLCLIK